MSALRKSLPEYTIAKAKVEINTLDPKQVIERLAERHAGKGRVNTDDGLRIDFDDSWVHLRPSNTEPIIRIISEAPGEARAKELGTLFTQEVLEGVSRKKT